MIIIKVTFIIFLPGIVTSADDVASGVASSSSGADLVDWEFAQREIVDGMKPADEIERQKTEMLQEQVSPQYYCSPLSHKRIAEPAIRAAHVSHAGNPDWGWICRLYSKHI